MPIRDDQFDLFVFSPGENPMAVPPVEEAWALMKGRLDIQMPVSRFYRFRKTFHKSVLQLRHAIIVHKLAVAGAAFLFTTVTAVWISRMRNSESYKQAHLEKSTTATYAPNDYSRSGQKSQPVEKYTYSRPESGTDHSQAADPDSAGLTVRPSGTKPALLHGSGVVLGDSVSRLQTVPGKSATDAYHVITPSGKRLTENLIRKSAPSGSDQGPLNGRHPGAQEKTSQSNTPDEGGPYSSQLAGSDNQSAQHTFHKISIVQLSADFPVTDREPSLGVASKSPAPHKIPHGHGILNDRIQMASGMTFKKSMVNPRYPVLSAGIEINKEFPIGSQQAPPYNVNARGNLLSDYIPAAYFRLHLNPRFYLEAAIQVNSPQYCESVVLSSHLDSLTYIPGRYNTTTTTLTLKKLYYTDVPVSLHYRLGNHLYIGTGIQLSYLRGGAVLQEVRYNGYGSVPDSVIQEAVSLKGNPSAYHFINKVDLRALLDLNYHWHRFALGVRYQQGLAGILKNSQAGSPSAGKNAALGIYLQWDIWKQK